MASRGTIIVEKYEWRGVVYPIMLNKNTGKFHVHIPNPDGTRMPLETFGGELPEVKEQLEKYLKESDGKDLKWEAVIIIKTEKGSRYGYNRSDEHALDLRYWRGFRAKTMSQKILWRDFKNGEDDVELDMREYNVDPPYFRHDGIELKYTPERWSSLRLITETMKLMNERLQKILEGGADEVTKMLQGISEKGAQMLLPAPKEGGKR